MLTGGVHWFVDGYIVFWRQYGGDLWTAELVLNRAGVIENGIVRSLGARFLLNY